MGENKDFFALDWIKGELDATLDSARRGLESYVEASDEASLRACLAFLHQVNGTLLMLELNGVATLSAEMENLALAMQKQALGQNPENQQLLMQGILQLPTFLEDIQDGRADRRQAVLPLANEMRLARGGEPFGDYDSTQENLYQRPNEEVLAHFESIEGRGKAARIRRTYQQVLLAVIKGERLETALSTLGKVAAGMERLCIDTPAATLFQAFGGFVESLGKGEARLDKNVIKLLRQIDVELKNIARDGSEALKRPVRLDLIRRFIHAAEERSFVSEQLEQISGAIDLADKSEPATISSRDAATKAAAALREELLAIRDRLDMCFRGETVELDKIRELAEPLKKIGSTLAVLGFESSRSIIADQMERLGELTERSDANEAALMSIASSLLQVDENLSGIAATRSDETGVQSQGSLIGDAQIAVLLEVRRGLETVKLKVVQYASTQWDADHLSDVPDLLMGIKGALTMIPLSRPAALLGRCAEYVQNAWVVGNIPDWQTMDVFADAISGIDYYLERLSENTVPKTDDILNRVEQSLAVLQSSITPESADSDDANATIADNVAVQPDDALLVQQSQSLSALKDGPRERPDAEIIEIFVEEVGEVLSDIGTYLPRWRADFEDLDAIGELRRRFHTLKGSGRIVTADLLGELAWSIENLLNRVLDGTLKSNAQIVSVTDDARNLVAPLCQAFEDEQQADADACAAVIERADILASGGSVNVSAADESEEVSPGVRQNESADFTQDSEEFAVFDEQSAEHMRVLKEFVNQHSEATNLFLEADMVLALQKLNSSAAQAGIKSVAAVAGPLYEVIGHLAETATEADEEHLEFLFQSVYALESIFSEMRDGREPEEDGSMFEAEADRLLSKLPESQTVSILELGAVPALLEIHLFVENWRNGTENLDQRDAILDALAEISGQAELDGYMPVKQLSSALSDALFGLRDTVPNADTFSLLDQAQETLVKAFDCVAAQQQMPSVDDLVSGLAVFAEERDPPSKVESAPGGLVDKQESVDPVTPDLDVKAEAVSETPLSDSQEHDDIDLKLLDDLDTEIVEIFFEEADELLESMEQSLNDWANERGNELHLENLLRVLHTLKGGARLAGLINLGNLTHEFESFLVELQNRGFEPDETFFKDVHDRVDNVSTLLERYKQEVNTSLAASGFNDEEDTKLAEISESEDLETETTENVTFSDERHKEPSAEFGKEPSAEFGKEPSAEFGKEPSAEFGKELSAEFGKEPSAEFGKEPSAESGKEPSAKKHEAPALLDSESVTPEEQSPEAETGAENTQTGKPPPSEMVRVSSLLLEKLVNLAGESSIIRSRVEQTISDFGQALGEMDNTISRLRDQLRRMEIETETQVLFRTEKEGLHHTDFDPLEMDRYSRMQEIARTLSESTSDMFELKDTLRVKSRESEMLLIQQARLNTELQEGLMRTRMVPFSRMLPRLKRIVRQVSRDVGKEVEMQAFNAEGEMDRNIIERMVPPLEHLLRNAIDHGLESADERKALGKGAVGRIELTLLREGGDMVLELSDDGRGIDVGLVRNKAIERELMHPDVELNDAQILQFILAPGFSTADSVTQISGRGVGMDVVHSEVKQLGGSIEIASTPGKGTRITLRLPFTVSVNRALMVMVGEDQYAIPLNSIEGIVRVPISEFEDINQPGRQTFEYAGIPYRLRYLGSYLGREYSTKSEQTSVPIVLVRSGDHAIALFVNSVQGSREIIVKSLGPQFAGVGGISGATILGDGGVVVILDVLSLIRGQMSISSITPPLQIEDAPPRCVMVVDDSVTVRKVTSRLLERQGMKVIVAKDGVEAMELLQEKRPDVMLLDIEMPRMDGFEVARQVRHDSTVSGLPIIMISSRTGAKHQEHAGALGVNKFLGKPFQESELLASIDELLDEQGAGDGGLAT